MKNKKISVSELDFDAIKSNLKTFLQGQTQFQDYDFEGSALSVIMDVLAYNTHYNALYTNLAINETFLDSASKRSSVVSRAKEIGYIPGSAKCPTATVNVVVSNTTSTPTSLTLPKNSLFTSVIDGKQYNFYTLENNQVVLGSDNKYTFTGITLREGAPLSIRYVANADTKFTIPNANVDLSTVTVTVQANSTSSTTEVFYRNEDILALDSTTPVYFVKEIEDELYELEFGNGVIGKALESGNVVTISYFITNKEAANGAKTFTYQGSTLLGGIVSTITTVPAVGGVDKEDIDTIRYNAPRAYQAQNRGVTVNDYKSIILSNYDEAESVNVWGGEDNVPPVYGKVFLSIKPKTTESLTSTQKEYIINNILKSRNIVTITPEIIDPDYIDLEIQSTVYYNPKTTTKTENQIKTLVTDSIKAYNDDYLNSFDGIFRFSQFSRSLDVSDPSIVSSITTLKLHREVAPKYDLSANYTINLVNPIYYSSVPEQSVLSSGFYIPGRSEVIYLEDYPYDLTNKIGTFKMFYYDSDLNKQYLPETIGTIVYATGSIEIKGLIVSGISGDKWEFVVKPQSNDVVSIRNQLVRIQDSNVTVHVIIDKVSVGDTAGNASYIFTSSRN